MHIVDPRDQLRPVYEAELAELRERLGRPRTLQERRRFLAEKRRLRRRIFGMLPPGGTARW